MACRLQNDVDPDPDPAYYADPDQLRALIKSLKHIISEKFPAGLFLRKAGKYFGIYCIIHDSSCILDLHLVRVNLVWEGVTIKCTHPTKGTEEKRQLPS